MKKWILGLLLLLVSCNYIDKDKQFIELSIKEVNNEVILEWIPPSEYTDGTPLSMGEIGGYKIYYGEASGTYNKIVNIPDAYIMSYRFTNLNSPTYFVVTCYTTGNIEGDYSNEVIYE